MRSFFACCAALLTTVGLIAAPAGGEETIPRLVSTYEGTIHNTTKNIKTTLELTNIRENQGNINGKVVIGPGLGGSGPFTGIINTDNIKRNVNFEVNSIFFKGSLRTDGSFGGTYSAPSARQEGTWQTTPATSTQPATSAKGEQPPGSGRIPVDQRFLGHFTTETGEPSIDITPHNSEEEVRVSLKWGPAKGELIGGISADGQLSSTGTCTYDTLLGGRSTWLCNLIGVINDDRFIGSYEFSPVSKPGTIIGDKFEGRPSGVQKGDLDLKKFKPAYPK
jgi:hypothetical protein